MVRPILINDLITLHKRFRPQRSAISFRLAVAREEERERLNVIVKAELGHGPQHVLGGDSLALLALATVIGFTSDEANVLRHTLLYSLLGVVRYFRMRRENPPHNSDDVGNRHVLVLLPDHTRAVHALSATPGGAIIVVGVGIIVTIGQRYT